MQAQLNGMKMILPVSEELGELSSICETSGIWECDGITLDFSFYLRLGQMLVIFRVANPF